MKTTQDGIEDLNEYDYFFENTITDEVLETNNRVEAIAVFNACLFECEVTYKGEVIGEKYREESLIDDTGYVLVTQLYEEDAEYCEL